MAAVFQLGMIGSLYPHTGQVCVVIVVPAVTAVVDTDNTPKGSLLVPFIQTKNKGVMSQCQCLA